QKNISAVVQGDAERGILIATAEVGRENQVRACGAELGDEHVAESAPVVCARRVGGHKVGGRGLAGNIHAAVAVHRDGPADVQAEAAEKRREYQHGVNYQGPAPVVRADFKTNHALPRVRQLAATLAEHIASLDLPAPA